VFDAGPAPITTRRLWLQLAGRRSADFVVAVLEGAFSLAGAGVFGGDRNRSAAARIREKTLLNCNAGVGDSQLIEAGDVVVLSRLLAGLDVEFV